jgi:5-methylcytosine-specific restriction endonuclease McrA
MFNQKEYNSRVEVKFRRNLCHHKYRLNPNFIQKEREYARKYRQLNKIELYEKEKQYWLKPENHLHRTQIQKKSYQKNKERRLQEMKNYRSTPEYKIKKKNYNKKYGQSKQHKKEQQIRTKKWREKNREYLKNKRTTLNYRIYHRAYAKKYYQTPKGKLKIRIDTWHRRKHLLNTIDDYSISKESLQTLIQKQNFCVYCGSKEHLTFDHIIPISKNGSHSIHNLTISCKECNCSKGNKSLSDWLLTSFCKNKNIRRDTLPIELQNE